MTVRILNTQHKVQLIKLYRSKALNQKQLAEYFAVSERTVNRILIEAGVATAVPRLRGEAYRAMYLLRKHDIKLDELELVISMGKTNIANIQQELEEDQYAYQQPQNAFDDLPF